MTLETTTTPPPAFAPGDARYDLLQQRGYNRRFTGAAARIVTPTSTAQVVTAVQEAIDAGERIAVRSGGHCFEGFVDDPDVSVLVDMTAMSAVAHDPVRDAVVVDAGARLGDVYRELHERWDVTIPAGLYPDVGIGGHVPGGGYGYLTRLHGLAIDHLEAVEVVVVDAEGTARSVIASRDQDDPAHDLWWAHTGGGGGSFGIATRFWFRTPETARRSAPLPRPPASVLTFSVSWPWDEMDEDRFTRLVRNHGEWCEQNATPGTPSASLYSELYLWRRSSGSILLEGQVAAEDGADEILAEHLAALERGVDVSTTREVRRRPWLESLLDLPEGADLRHRLKFKGGTLRRRFTDEQIAALYRHLGDPQDDYPGGGVVLHTLGGQVNAVAPTATATAHRDAVTELFFFVGWADAAEDERHLAWIRDLYRDVYAATGGVPAPSANSCGSYINYPDMDLADPAWNTSGVPWSEIYFGQAYGRLQEIKAAWDPGNHFRHALSVRPGGA
ncbi:FAD-binding oxidoreductase [Pseudactinotalea sp.]|uniref:FAD-binding oxidoreductase n=1 Tax=Pseudactinotalea sp. TaxID=1926260 RepID=UPI003B3BBA8C